MEILPESTSNSSAVGSDDDVTTLFQLSQNSRHPMLDHQDKYIMKAQIHVSKSSAISGVQALPQRKYYYQNDKFIKCDENDKVIRYFDLKIEKKIRQLEIVCVRLLELEFSWGIVLATVIEFLGSVFGTVGGAVVPMLMLGITLGVPLSVVFPYWLIIVLIIILLLDASSCLHNASDTTPGERPMNGCHPFLSCTFKILSMEIEFETILSIYQKRNQKPVSDDPLRDSRSKVQEVVGKECCNDREWNHPCKRGCKACDQEGDVEIWSHERRRARLGDRCYMMQQSRCKTSLVISIGNTKIQILSMEIEFETILSISQKRNQKPVSDDPLGDSRSKVQEEIGKECCNDGEWHHPCKRGYKAFNQEGDAEIWSRERRRARLGDRCYMMQHSRCKTNEHDCNTPKIGCNGIRV
nr:sulfite exporter TauE/SafE family protein [Tanacetum cinerariifolium]